MGDIITLAANDRVNGDNFSRVYLIEFYSIHTMVVSFVHSSDLFKAVQVIVNERDTHLQEPPIDVLQFFLNQLRNLIDEQTDEPLKMTRMSILFEGFYRYLSDNDFKQVFLRIRTRRWQAHFGPPTILFLLSYKNQINNTKRSFEGFLSINVSKLVLSWRVCIETSYAIDDVNNVIVDLKSLDSVHMPTAREITGIFTKTHNPFGGFTTTACDPMSI